MDVAPAAQRQVRRLPPLDAARARLPILALSRDPRPPGVARLADTDLPRARAGDMRVVYAVDDTERVVVVLRVARRGESTYRQVR